MTLLLLAAVGCSEPDPGTTFPTIPQPAPPNPVVDTEPVDSGGTDPTEPLPDGLHGTVPAKPIPPPVFKAVLNRDNNPRHQADLIGHPTAVWFYPAATTGG